MLTTLTQRSDFFQVLIIPTFQPQHFFMTKEKVLLAGLKMYLCVLEVVYFGLQESGFPILDQESTSIYLRISTYPSMANNVSPYLLAYYIG